MRLLASSVALSLFTVVGAQSPPASSVDYYAGFVGKWIGTDHFLQADAWVTIPVEITISASRKNDRLRFDYSYGKKGDENYDQQTRFLVLNPRKEELTLQWKGTDKTHYRTTGLGSFARDGHGSFLAIGKVDDVTYVGSFNLEQDTFNYYWETTTDEKSFAPESQFSFHRIPSTGSSTPTQPQ